MRGKMRADPRIVNAMRDYWRLAPKVGQTLPVDSDESEVRGRAFHTTPHHQTRRVLHLV